MKVCPKCGTHVRTLLDSHKPIGCQWFIYFPPDGRYKFRGWVHMSQVGEKIQHDETTQPVQPAIYGNIDKQDERDATLTENARIRAGLTR